MQILSLDEIRQNLLDLGVSLGVLSRSLACFHGFSWLLLPSGWVRDSFGTWHEGRDYTTWEETLYHMEVDFVHKGQDFVPHDSKSVPNEQQIGYMTLVGSEPKEIQG